MPRSNLQSLSTAKESDAARNIVNEVLLHLFADDNGAASNLHSATVSYVSALCDLHLYVSSFVAES